ncbi:MAG: OmpA family protein [Lewinella sp.]|nr:OmpA family protein [Lewinella sp.]
MKKWLVALGYSLLVCTLLSAQPRAEIGLLAGGSGYLGDLTPSDMPPFDTWRPAVAVRAGWHIRYTWQIRLQLAYAQLAGTDQSFSDPEFAQQRGFSFKTDLGEASLQLVWEPWGKTRFPARGGYRAIISPYLYAGWGAAWINPSTDFGPHADNGFRTRVVEDQKALPAGGQWVLPLGAGIHFDLSPRTSLGLEAGVTKTYTDYLDGISMAANPDAADWYAHAGITLTHRWTRPDYDRDRVLDADDQCPREAGLLATHGCPDADKDGVIDLYDMCPYQKGAAELQGCPDDDYDGVANLLDKCPDYPGSVGAAGCPDADGDGLGDDDDLCPDCPGEASAQGCPDTDGDGVQDARDRCPYTPGRLEWSGCPYPDADLDGVADADDACPDLRGPRALHGCPDADGDGITDAEDACPDLAGTLADSGCPPVPEEVETILELVTEAVQFETGSARLRPTSLEKLNELVRILGDYPYFYLRIEGHTDSQGAAAKNKQLSEDRARACYNYLLENDIAAERMQFVGYGEEQPIADNATAAGRRENRRVMFQLFVP